MIKVLMKTKDIEGGYLTKHTLNCTEQELVDFLNKVKPTPLVVQFQSGLCYDTVWHRISTADPAFEASYWPNDSKPFDDFPF